MGLPTAIAYLFIAHHFPAGQAADPIKALASRIAAETQHLHGVEIAFDVNGQLTATYQAQTIQHKRIFKTGRVLPGTFPELEPGKSGFVITARAFDHRPSEPAQAFQQVVMPGDRMDRADYQVKGQDKAMFFEIQWGPEASQALIRRLRRTPSVGSTRIS